MFAGPELLILVVALLVVAIVTGSVLRGVRRRNSKPSSALVSGAPSDVISDLQLALAGARNEGVVRDSEWSLTVTLGYIPTSAIIVAILFPPIGLLALFARDSVAGAVLVEERSGARTAIRMGGTFQTRSVRRINDVITARSQAVAVGPDTPSGYA